MRRMRSCARTAAAVALLAAATTPLGAEEPVALDDAPLTAQAPPGWPAYHWDTARSMLFFHSGNESGFYSAASASKISGYAAVTIEKFEGSDEEHKLPRWRYDEDMMIEELRRQDARRPGEQFLIFYMNGWKDRKQMTRMHEQYLAHPHWQLFYNVTDPATKAVGSCGSKKSGCAFDVSLPEVQEWWIETCYNATRRIRASGTGVGCYADASNTYPRDPQSEKDPNDAMLLWPELANQSADTRAKAEAWTAGLRAMTTRAQEVVGRSSFIVGKTAIQPGVGALQIEGFAANNDSINAMQMGVRLGKLVEGHIGMGGSSGGVAHPGCGVPTTTAAAQMMEDHLATFLIAAGPYCYLGCGEWNSIKGDGMGFIDNAWVDYKLGAPLEDGALDSTGVWRRKFSSGTTVSFDPTTNHGEVVWAGHHPSPPAPPAPPAPGPPAPPGPSPAGKPIIIQIVADDLGRWDVGWRNPSMLTPTLDKLVADGVELKEYYTFKVCGPSRSSILTGRYPFNVGYYGNPGNNRIHVPLNFSLTSDALQQHGFRTHAIGKWHVGFAAKEYTATYRGFLSFLGYYEADEDYYNHTHGVEKRFRAAGRCANGSTASMVDLSNSTGLDVLHASPALKGKYSADIYAGEAVRIIEAHPAAEGMYMYLAMQNVHTPMKVPAEYEARYPHVPEGERRTLCGMVSALDDAIGKIVAALQAHGLWERTWVTFAADNGGSVAFSSSNYPLRGGKFTYFEGGLRTNAFVSSPLLPEARRGASLDGLAHSSDWLPTIHAIAGLAPSASEGPRHVSKAPYPIDGLNLLPAIEQGVASPRTEVLHMVDPPNSTKSASNLGVLRMGKYKLIATAAGKFYNWSSSFNGSEPYPPPGPAPPAPPGPVSPECQEALESKCADLKPPKDKTNKCIKKCTKKANKKEKVCTPSEINSYCGGSLGEGGWTVESLEWFREQEWLMEMELTSDQPCADTPCLYDVEADPNEHTDLYAKLPQVASQLEARLRQITGRWVDQRDLYTAAEDNCEQAVRIG
jgi:arylsulfatase A-like enzyme